MTGDWARKQEAKGQSLSPEAEEIVALAVSDSRALMDHRPLRESPLFRLPQFDISFDDIAFNTVMPDNDASEIEIPTGDRDCAVALDMSPWSSVRARSLLHARSFLQRDRSQLS
jgi:hypothetical protein